jgi:hypothetical protein
MPVIILCVFRFVRLLGTGYQAIAVENLALRRQLAAIQEKTEKACADAMGPAVLGRFVAALERLAGRAGFCSAGSGRPLAAGAVPQVLGPTISTQAWSPRVQSPLASAENP